ncbi:hypothetical protein [Actinophytocola sp. NPDC049390]|uniref:hypothetical protein n=1 Tax=Actinophytocola sp. NPDC049390 TaxID=3363894 RepID=UPI0037BA62F9
MNSRTRLACGVAIGYLLGRTRKMRLALMVAGVTGAAGTPRQLVQRGLKQLGSVPEVGKLTTLARGQLVDAAKTAAVTAASSRIDALNERLQGGPAPEDDEETPRRPTREDREDTDAEPSAESHEDERDDDEEPAEPAEDDANERPRPRRRASGTARRRASDSDDEPRRNSARRSSRAPVRRAGR